MAIGSDRGQYRRVEQGKVDPAPMYLWEDTEHIEGRDETLYEASRAIIAHRNADKKGTNQFTEQERTAWEVCGEVASNRQEHLDLMRLSQYMAQTDTEYWGVSDPESERYCSACREPHPVEMFPTGEYNCYASKEE